MPEEEKLVQHLHEIKQILVEKEAFFPYNYTALIVWGLLGAVMTLVMPKLLAHSVLYGTLFSICMMGMGFWIESRLTRRVNADYEIENSTAKQRFVFMSFLFLLGFAVLVSAFLAEYRLIVPVFTVWLFACGFGHFVVGYVLNMSLFTVVSYLKMGAGALLLTAALFVEHLDATNTPFFYFVQGVTLLLLGVVPVWMGWKLKKEARV